MRPTPIILALAAATLSVTTHAVPVPSQTNKYTTLPGTTLAQRPELAGKVLVDEVIPFSVKSTKNGMFSAGKLQSRVVRRNSTGTLDFYWRVIPAPEATAMPWQLNMDHFNALDSQLDLDFRIDGLGTSIKSIAEWGKPFGSVVILLQDFGCDGITKCPVVAGGTRFFLAATKAKTYAKTARMLLITGPFVPNAEIKTFSPTYPTFKPFPPPKPAVRATN